MNGVLFPNVFIISIMRTFEYRLYPTKEQRDRLQQCLTETRQAYNTMLDYAKAQYEQSQTFPSKYDLTAAFAGTAGEHTPATTLQTIADSLAKALKFFGNHRHERQPDGSPRVGFPRFKQPNQWHSFQLRQYGPGRDVHLDGRHLSVPRKLGSCIKIKVHRPFDGTPKTAYLVKRVDGHWYALLVCETPPVVDVVPTEDNRPPIGIDVDLKSFLTDSNGDTVANPRFFLTSQKTIRRKQRTLSRRQKGSNRRKKAARSVAQSHLKIDRQRRDFHFKVAHHYAVLYALIVVEHLHIAGMARNRRLSKSILDAGWASFLNILQYKAERAGSEVRRIDARYTTQRCSRCGELTPKSLSVRTHVCQHCSFVLDRDHNAAINILRAGARPSGTIDTSRSDELRSHIL